MTQPAFLLLTASSVEPGWPSHVSSRGMRPTCAVPTRGAETTPRNKAQARQVIRTGWLCFFCLCHLGLRPRTLDGRGYHRQVTRYDHANIHMLARELHLLTCLLHRSSWAFPETGTWTWTPQ